MKHSLFTFISLFLCIIIHTQGHAMNMGMNVNDTITLEYHYTYDSWGRPLTTTLSYNGEEAVTIENNTYDALGRLSQTARNGQDSLTTQYAYNIRDWVTQIQSPVFTENLYYNTSANGSTPQWGGNISAQEWTTPKRIAIRIPGRPARWQIVQMVQGYNFEYDAANRLASAQYIPSEIPALADREYSTEYTYDMMGNILTMQRNGLLDDNEYGLLDDLTYIYEGNQLIGIREDNDDEPTYADAMHFRQGEDVDPEDEDPQYTYNANGSLTEDRNKGIAVEYNALNLPSTIEHFTAPLAPPETIRYTYAADGRKLRVEHYPNIILQPQIIGYDNEGHPIFGPPPAPAPELTIDYCGPFIYEDGQLKRVLFDGGYITFNANSNNAPEYHFYITDHLGNIRAVLNENNAIEEVNHYYPYGSLFGESSGLANSTQPYKYTGKELDRMHGLDLHDFGARFYDSNLGQWSTIDKLAESYYPYTPYGYSLTNPINNFDPDGNSVWTKLGKAIIKVGKAVAKNGVKALANTATYVSAVDGVISDVQTLTSSGATTGERVVAGVSLASELLPISVGDIKEGINLIKGVKTAKKNTEKLQESAKIGKEAHRQIEKGLKESGAQIEVKKELTGGMIVRKDAIRTDGTAVIIKPDTPSGHKSAKRREQLMHDNGYKTETIYYNPEDPKYLPNSPTYIGPKK